MLGARPTSASDWRPNKISWDPDVVTKLKSLHLPHSWTLTLGNPGPTTGEKSVCGSHRGDVTEPEWEL